MNRISVKKPSLDTLLKLFLSAVVLIAGVSFLLSDKPPTVDDLDITTITRESFSKCLNERGVIMYGVDTCDFCETQKKMFGRDFQEFKYVNCDFDADICISKGITKYPVWQIDETLLVGIQTFENLANATGCISPK